MGLLGAPYKVREPNSKNCTHVFFILMKKKHGCGSINLMGVSISGLTIRSLAHSAPQDKEGRVTHYIFHLSSSVMQPEVKSEYCSAIYRIIVKIMQQELNFLTKNKIIN